MADGKHQTDGATAVPSQKLSVTENLNILTSTKMFRREIAIEFNHGYDYGLWNIKDPFGLERS